MNWHKAQRHLGRGNKDAILFHQHLHCYFTAKFCIYLRNYASYCTCECICECTKQTQKTFRAKTAYKPEVERALLDNLKYVRGPHYGAWRAACGPPAGRCPGLLLTIGEFFLEFADRRITIENTQGLQQFTQRSVKELLLRATMVDPLIGIPYLQRGSQEHRQDIETIPGVNFTL